MVNVIFVSLTRKVPRSPLKQSNKSKQHRVVKDVCLPNAKQHPASRHTLKSTVSKLHDWQQVFDKTIFPLILLFLLQRNIWSARVTGKGCCYFGRVAKSFSRHKRKPLVAQPQDQKLELICSSITPVLLSVPHSNIWFDKATFSNMLLFLSQSNFCFAG